MQRFRSGHRAVALQLGLALVASLALPGCAGLLQKSGGSAARNAAQSQPVKLTKEEQVVLDETNAFRKRQGLGPLEADGRLTAIARFRSQDMASRGYFAHITPEGGDVFTLMRKNEVRYWAAGENLARNNYTLEESPSVAMQGWIKSPGHRANLLHPSFGHLGIGLAVAADGKKYLTQVFTD